MNTYVPAHMCFDARQPDFVADELQTAKHTDQLAPGRVAQSETCLVKDAKLTADPGVASSIPAQSHTFVEIDLK